MDAKPKDAAAIILLRAETDPRNPEIYWVQRSHKLAFLGGFYAFPGGQLEPDDAEVDVLNCNEQERSAMISCAARELFEELGVLLARGAESLTRGQRDSLIDDLESGRMPWPVLLRHYDLRLAADDFTFVGRWVTPPFSPRRFDTCFFLARCPVKQQPEPRSEGELSRGEWITARDAYARWEGFEALAVPPILHALKTLGDGITSDLVDRFLALPEAHAKPVRRIEFRPGYICFPVRTPTKPPATHTNCYLIHTDRELLIVDPGSPYEDEQQALASCADDLINEGRKVRAIVLTHLHPDHVGGVEALRVHFHEQIQVWAHSLTAEGLRGSIQVDKHIADGEVIELDGHPPRFLRALHTPGHARGHLCFHEQAKGVLLTGDNIVGLGSVLVDPPEGNMRDYLGSLQRLRSLEGLTVLFGGHGPAMAYPYKRIDEYINHRLEREQKILSAVRQGAATPEKIVAVVYTDVSPKAFSMAERAIQAHLDKLQDEGLVVEGGGRYSAV